MASHLSRREDVVKIISSGQELSACFDEVDVETGSVTVRYKIEGICDTENLLDEDDAADEVRPACALAASDPAHAGVHISSVSNAVCLCSLP